MIYINIRYDHLPKLTDNNIYKIQLYKTICIKVSIHMYKHI